MIKALFFDLDGTLLPLNTEVFLKSYVGLLSEFVKPLGYDKDLFVKTLLDGLKRMYQNDGSKSNADIFWEVFALNFGEEELVHRPKFDIFYETEFLKLKAICGENKEARKIIDFCRENNLITVLTTNPILPGRAAIHRMSFVGLKPEDFEFITFMETFNYTKPNPQYFIDVLKKLNLKPDEVIMIGNDEVEDGACAEAVGIKTYLINSGCLIKDKKQERNYPLIKTEEVIETIKKHL